MASPNEGWPNIMPWCSAKDVGYDKSPQGVGWLILILVGSCMRSVTRLQSSLYATAWKLARPTPTRTFTTELASGDSPQPSVSYNYTGKQSIPVTALSIKKHKRLSGLYRIEMALRADKIGLRSPHSQFTISRSPFNCKLITVN